MVKTVKPLSMLLLFQVLMGFDSTRNSGKKNNLFTDMYLLWQRIVKVTPNASLSPVRDTFPFFSLVDLRTEHYSALRICEISNAIVTYDTLSFQIT